MFIHAVLLGLGLIAARAQQCCKGTEKATLVSHTHARFCTVLDSQGERNGASASDVSVPAKD